MPHLRAATALIVAVSVAACTATIGPAGEDAAGGVPLGASSADGNGAPTEAGADAGVSRDAAQIAHVDGGPANLGVTSDDSGASVTGTTGGDSGADSADATAPCSGNSFFCDDFTNPALAFDYDTYNGAWVRGVGSYTVTDENAWERAQATLPYDITDFDVTFAGHTMGDYGFGVIYAATADKNQGYAVVVHPAQFQSIYLKQLVAGQDDIDIASAPLPTGLAGTRLTVRITRQASTVTVWLNGTQMLSASDGSSGAGGVLGPLLSATDITAGGGAVFNLLRVDSASALGDAGHAVSHDAGEPTEDAGRPDDAGGGTTAPASGTIHSAPTGPATPEGGWHVDLADDFNTPLGTGAGQDNLWYPNQAWAGAPTDDSNGDNSFETETYNGSQVSVSGGLLRLTAVYQYDRAPAENGYVQRNYVSGLVSSPTNIPGYKGFTWTPGDGSTWAFEIVCQWPANTGELFNAWWSSTQSGWTDERDFFEGKGTHFGETSGGIDSDWIYSTSPIESDYYQTDLAFDPSAAMHRYTYVVSANQSWSTYVDGALQTWVGTNGVAPVESSNDSPMDLIINYALTSTTFTSGARTFLIDSVAVYQDGDHAGQSAVGGGVAPGTVVGP